MARNLFLTIAFLLPYFHVYAQSEAHRIIKERMDSKKIPGIAFLIAKDGKILDQGYFGKANLELDVDVTEESVFAIASMSKTFTAAAILLMAEKGMLSLNESIKKYIPEAPDFWEPITIKHLLTHSSGLVEDWSLYDWNASNELFLKTQTDSGFLKVHFEQELKFKPGTDVSYASGHFILGIVIERITGKFYGDFLSQNIFEPLGLKSTYVDHPYKIIPNRVSGYFYYEKDVINSPVEGLGNGIAIAPVAHGRGDSGLRTTTKDLLKFYTALLGNDFLSEESKKLMFEPATLDNGNYISTGAGWMNWPLGGMAISEHSGGFRTGFSSQAIVIPKEKFVVIVLSNLKGPESSYSGASFTVAKKLASLYYPEMGQLSKKQVQEDPNLKLTQQHLDFFKNMDSNENHNCVSPQFPYSYYSKNLKRSISQTTSISYLGEKDVRNDEMIFFNARIHTLRYYRLNGKKALYTTAYLDQNEKLVFIDYPEEE